MTPPLPTAHQKALALYSAKNFIADRGHYTLELLAAQVRARQQLHLELAQVHRVEAKATAQAWKSYLAQTHNTDPNEED
jgi:hypothetical protein